jgi:hypothetical protein
VAGALAGFIASLALSAMLLLAGMNGTTHKLLEETMPQVYTAEQMAFLQSNGLTLDVFTQYVTMIQVVCCGAAMPLAGVVLGALGGYTAPDAPA